MLLVGRQHLHSLRSLWEDEGSPLWRDEMPRDLGPSVIDDINARAAAAAEVRGGSGAGPGAGAAGDEGEGR